MTLRGSQLSSQALSDLETQKGLERHYPPASLLVAGTVLVMNVCATVLSLMA